MMYGDHPREDSITAVASTSTNEYILTGDTQGQLKLWNFKNFVFNKDHSTDNLKIEWFIMAHSAMINSIQVCEAFKAGHLIISASSDNNVHLHRLSNGAFIGQFS